MAVNGLSVLGVPSSAGAHHAGQDGAPRALRTGGLLQQLRSRVADLRDEGDLPTEVFKVDPAHPTHRNLPAVVGVARAAADATERILRSGRTVLVLGGDCTITLGVVAGAQRVHRDVGLAYFDGDADLTTPVTTRSGILDSMGVAHLLGIADTDLARLDRPAPMLADDHLVMLGYDPNDPDSFDKAALAAHPGVLHFPDHELREAPEAVARHALETLTSRTSHLIVHFDVDAVTSSDLPLGNFPHYGTGIPLDNATTVLKILCAAPQLAAIVLTEVNPSYDPSGRQLDRYIDAITQAIAS